MSQRNRPARVSIGSLNPDGYFLTAFGGVEAISRPYRFTLEVVAPADAPLRFEDVLGQPALVAIDQGVLGLQTRFVHGVINRLTQGRQDNRFRFYRAELVPALWLLSRQFRSRIFQQQTTREIIEQVIGTLYAPRFNLEGEYFPRNYCVQYRETDLAFISRLMEEEGMYYYFAHSAAGHELVIADNPRGHDPVPVGATFRFQDASRAVPRDGRVTRWEKGQELRTGIVELSDHHFQFPTGQRLDITAFPLDAANVGTVEHKLTLATGEAAIVDHPGGYARWRDGIDQGGTDRPDDPPHVFDDNSRIAMVRQEAEQARAIEIDADSTYCRLAAGHKFTLADHFDADGEYLATSVKHHCVCGVGDSGEAVGFEYGNRFACIPLILPFRPERSTPRPFIRGTQTATVVGDDPEIDPDKFGRVKVLFHWDPEPSRGLGTSCWVRVAQFWAGKQWGAQFIPRVGDEVVVTFLEGDPDRPLIVGSVYNSDNMPIYALPQNKTQSGIKTHSSPGGTEKNFNEIRFEDKKGAELIHVHAERNMSTTVEASETVLVGVNSSTTVGNNSTVTIGTDSKADPRTHGKSTTTIFGDTAFTVSKGDYSFDIQTGKATYHVTGDVTEKYDAKQTTTVKGDQFTHVTDGHHLVKVATGHASLHVDSGNRYVNVGAGFYDVIAATKITLTVGASSLEMLSNGTITLKGVNVTVEGSAVTTIKGNPVKINC
jgi:type VI secretion system secreted protein VgrG